MDIKINFKDKEKALITLSGEIDFSNSHILKDRMLNLLGDGYKKIELDFAGVKNIDSSGLGKLFLFNKRLKEVEGKMMIKNVKSDYVKKMFDLMHLHKIIEIKE